MCIRLASRTFYAHVPFCINRDSLSTPQSFAKYSTSYQYNYQDITSVLANASKVHVDVFPIM